MCQVKGVTFLSCLLAYLLTNTPPKSEISPSELDDISKYTKTELAVPGINGHFKSYWPFDVLQVISLRVACCFF